MCSSDLSAFIDLSKWMRHVLLGLGLVSDFAVCHAIMTAPVTALVNYLMGTISQGAVQRLCNHGGWASHVTEGCAHSVVQVCISAFWICKIMLELYDCALYSCIFIYRDALLLHFNSKEYDVGVGLKFYEKT